MLAPCRCEEASRAPRTASFPPLRAGPALNALRHPPHPWLRSVSSAAASPSGATARPPLLLLLICRPKRQRASSSPPSRAWVHKPHRRRHAPRRAARTAGLCSALLGVQRCAPYCLPKPVAASAAQRIEASGARGPHARHHRVPRAVCRPCAREAPHPTHPLLARRASALPICAEARRKRAEAGARMRFDLRGRAANRTRGGGKSQSCQTACCKAKSGRKEHPSNGGMAMLQD